LYVIIVLPIREEVVVTVVISTREVVVFLLHLILKKNKIQNPSVTFTTTLFQMKRSYPNNICYGSCDYCGHRFEKTEKMTPCACKEIKMCTDCAKTHAKKREDTHNVEDCEKCPRAKNSMLNEQPNGWCVYCFDQDPGTSETSGDDTSKDMMKPTEKKNNNVKK
jgi:hypothetical protein